MKIVGGMAARQIARDVQAAPSTIDRLLGRLGRHGLLLHTQLTEGALPQGPVVLDSFESFEFSQYFPFQHHLLTEARTSFFWHFTDSALRRKGRMTEAQKKRRAVLESRLGTPDPQAVKKDVGALLEPFLTRLRALTLRSDDHRVYPQVLRQFPCQTTHEVTSSKERRSATNPLFEINLLDSLIRHSQANHRRETLAFSKRRQGSAERLGIFLIWRNYMKLRFEKRCRATPAMLQGLLPKRLGLGEVLCQRLFRTRVALPGRWADYYERAIPTVALATNRRHRLRYAY